MSACRPRHVTGISRTKNVLRLVAAWTTPTLFPFGHSTPEIFACAKILGTDDSWQTTIVRFRNLNFAHDIRLMFPDHIKASFFVCQSRPGWGQSANPVPDSVAKSSSSTSRSFRKKRKKRRTPIVTYGKGGHGDGWAAPFPLCPFFFFAFLMFILVLFVHTNRSAGAVSPHDSNRLRRQGIRT